MLRLFQYRDRIRDTHRSTAHPVQLRALRTQAALAGNMLQIYLPQYGVYSFGVACSGAAFLFKKSNAGARGPDGTQSVRR